MKKMNVIIFVIAALGCFVASGRPVLSLNNVAVLKSGEVIKVIYQGNLPVPVNLIILDADGVEIFQEKIISTNGFIRPYNFSKLPKGNYQLRVVDPNGEYLEDVYFQGEWKTKHTHDKPFIGHITKLTGDENKYLVVVPGQFAKGFSVQVFDQNEELVFSEKQETGQDFARVYNLKNLNGATIKLQPDLEDEVPFKMNKR
jgi:hypothetical protein